MVILRAALQIKSMVFAIILIGSVGATAFCGTISGSVTNHKKKPLAGVFVSARNVEGKFSVTVVSREDGSYSISDLLPGRYSVTAHQIGFVSSSDSLGVSNASVIDRHFVLATRASVEDQLPASSFMALLPEGEKKRALAVACMGCHQFDKKTFEKDGKRLTEEQWSASFKKMIGMFGVGTGFPIIPSILDEKETSAWLAENLHDGNRYAPESVPRPVRSTASRVRYTEYDMPHQHELPHDVMVDPVGKVVVTGMSTNAMHVLDPATHKFTSYPISGEANGPRALEIENDGTWWVLLGNHRKIGRFNPAESQWTKFDIEEYPHSIARGKDGSMWFNGHFSTNPERIAKLNPETGKLSWYHVPVDSATLNTGGPIPYELRIAPDGKVWGGELVGNRIFGFDPRTESFEIYTMPVSFSGPRRFDIGEDGVLWIPEYGGNALTRFSPATKTFKRYPYPTSSALPYVVRVNHKNGMIWMATAGSDEVASFNPKTESFVVYPLPTRGALIRHMDIDMKNGTIWAAYAPFPPKDPKVVRIEIQE